MRMRGKIDANQPEIVRALRQVGATVLSLADIGEGCPDLLVGFRGKSILMEVKDGMLPPSKKRLTPDEELWHKGWQGSPVLIVESVNEALKYLNSIG